MGTGEVAQQLDVLTALIKVPVHFLAPHSSLELLATPGPGI